MEGGGGRKGGGGWERERGVSVYGNIVNNKEIRYYVSSALRHSYLVSANGVPAGVV